jgi:beta-lactamase superfamily II metal-dependent hydrolase
MKKSIPIILISIFFVLSPVNADNLEVHVINVGQGDSLLIKSPNGTTCLIDAGDNGKGTSAVMPYLTSLGITSLDYLVASHYHSDHIGGIDEVISGLGDSSNISVAAYDGGGSYTTITYDDYVAAVGTKRTTITPGQTIDLGGDARLECIAANGYISSGQVYSGAHPNPKSVVLILKYKCFQMFLGGDSEYMIEDDLTPLTGDVDIYKVNHHASDTSSTEDFLNELNPEVSIICVGNNNTYGHPDPNTLSLIADKGYVYQTETGVGAPPADQGIVANGNFKIVTNGYAYVILGSSIPIKIRLVDELDTFIGAIIE